MRSFHCYLLKKKSLVYFLRKKNFFLQKKRKTVPKRLKKISYKSKSHIFRNTSFYQTGILGKQAKQDVLKKQGHANKRTLDLIYETKLTKQKQSRQSLSRHQLSQKIYIFYKKPLKLQLAPKNCY